MHTGVNAVEDGTRVSVGSAVSTLQHSDAARYSTVETISVDCSTNSAADVQCSTELLAAGQPCKAGGLCSMPHIVGVPQAA